MYLTMMLKKFIFDCMKEQHKDLVNITDDYTNMSVISLNPSRTSYSIYIANVVVDSRPKHVYEVRVSMRKGG